MASGTIEKKFHGGSTGGYYFGIDWSATANASTNSSSVTASVFIRSSGNGYTISSTASKKITLTINGTSYSGNATVGIGANTKKTLFTKTVTVGHNSDGSKTCAFACSGVLGLTLSNTYYGTVSHSGSGTFDKINLNTAPYWGTNDDTHIELNGTAIKSHVIIPENTGNVTVVACAASDKETPNAIHYDIHRYVNENYSAKIKAGGYGRTVVDNLSPWGQGTQFKYEVKVHDGSLWVSNPASRFSWTYTKNTFTRASVDSIGSIGINTTKVAFRAYGIANSGGGNGYVNNNFAYRIESLTTGVTIGGEPTHSQDNAGVVNFELGVKNNGGSPTNPHWLDANELRAALKSSNYCGNIKLRLVSWNSYGSQGHYDFNIWVDLRKAAPSTTVSYSSNNYITFNNTNYYIPAYLPFTVSWNAVKDSVGGEACSYELYYQIGSGSYVWLGSTSSTSYTAYLGTTAIGNNVTENFRIVVRVKTAYGYHTDSFGSQIKLHSYAPPTVKITEGPVRGRNSVKIVGTITTNTSIPNVKLYRPHWRWTNGNNTIMAETMSPGSFTINTTVAESFAGTMHIASSDNIRELIVAKGIDMTWGYIETSVKGYMPVMSLNKLGLGVGTRVDDSQFKFMVEGNTKTTGLTVANITKTAGLSVTGYSTTNTQGSYNGYWTKVADFQVTGQYGDANAIIKFLGRSSGDATAVSGELVARVKQQNPMGQAPGISLYLNSPTIVGADNFKMVTTSNTASLTKVELWYKAARGYETVGFSPIVYVGTINFYSNQTYQSSLPSGTQTSAVVTTISNTQLTTRQNVYGRIAQIGGDGVMEVGKYIDFHDGDNGQDYSYRITCNGGTLDLGGGVYTYDMNVNTITTRGHIQLPNNGSSWLNGATNGNIRGTKQSTGSYHSIISQTTSSNHKISLGGLGDEFGFHLYDAGRTANGIDKYFRFRLSDKTLHTDVRPHISEWLYLTGNYGVYFSSHGGGLYMQDSTWIRSYADKYIYTGGGMKSWTKWARYFKSYDGHNVDIECDSGTGFFNVYSGSGAGIIVARPWSGSSGSEPAFYNNKGNGWGFLGNSGTAWYRVYGSGGSVSDRNKKYEITKADTEIQYENVRDLNIYNYRTLSTVDTEVREMAENFLSHSKFKDANTLEFITNEIEIEGKIYKALDEELTQEEIKEKRIEQIIELNPNFGECKRQDLSLGCMIDEMPLETTFYDNEGGDGKAVDMYSYTTMILGATKHLINKVETLESENEELRNKLDRMEGLLNGIVNEG